MLITKKEHQCYGVVQFVHLLEVWDLVEITDIKDGKVLDAIGDLYMEKIQLVSKVLKLSTSVEPEQ